AAGLVAFGHLRWAGVVLIFAGTCDILDGALARSTHASYPYGAFLDSTLDRYSEGAVYLGLAAYFVTVGGPLQEWLVLATLAALGKAMTARALASALLPASPLTRHPDYWEDDRIKPLSINEIRLLPDKPPEFHELSLQAFLNLKPAIGGRRVVVVTNVGRVRDQDQGVLLKTLEEPHPHRVIVLTTPSLNPFVVLPTVVSRCQRLFFHPVPALDIEKLL